MILRLFLIIQDKTFHEINTFYFNIKNFYLKINTVYIINNY
jgi:hypothetical protein